jgi:Flp pilus assembly protein TadG
MPSSWLPRRFLLRRGAIAPLTALCLALLVGVAALVIDGGTLMEARRHVQAAADAAALAGADDLYCNYLTNQGIDVNGTALASALATASANGFANDGVQSVVTVHTSPQKYQGGPNAGQTIPPGYIEVLIQYNVAHLFSGVLGTGTSPVRARAVARGRCTPLKSNGVIALSLNAAGALNVASLGGLTVNGTIQVNSGSSSALNITSTVAATQFILNPSVGSLSANVLSLLSGLGGSEATIVTSPPSPDPLRYLPPPNPGPLQTLVWNGNTVTCLPGVYNNGIQISGGTLLNPITVRLGNSDGTPGIYYLNANGFQVSGWVNIMTVGGIMIYNNWSNASTDIIKVSTYGAVTITPPAYGPYCGLCIFQKRGTSLNPAPSVTLNAQGSANVTGTIYAAHANVSLTTNLSSNVMGGQIIADTITTNGAAAININPGAQPTANLRLLGLVE